VTEGPEEEKKADEFKSLDEIIAEQVTNRPWT